MLSKEDKEFAHDIIANDIEYCEDQGFPCEWSEETAPSLSRNTLLEAGFSEKEIEEAFDSFKG